MKSSPLVRLPDARPARGRRALLLPLACVACIATACGDEEGEPKGPGGGAAPLGMEYLNAYRELMGLPAATHSATLQRGAQAHADYYVQNLLSARQDCVGPSISPHDEVAGCPGYTGQYPWDRAATAGYSGGSVGECMHFVNDPEWSMLDWQESVYHRFCIATPVVLEAGYAKAGANPGNGADVLDVGFMGIADPNLAARWPVPDAQDVPRSWAGNESPLPPPPPTGYPSGPVVGLIFAASDSAHVTSGTLTDRTGSVPAVFLSPDNDPELANSNGYFLYAHRPLLELRDYTVTFSGTRNGAPYQDAWTFFVPCDGTGGAQGRVCDGNELLGCAGTQVSRSDCGTDTCVEYPAGASCVPDATANCTAADGAFLRCEGSLLLVCQGGYEVIGTDCGADVCTEGPYGATCATEPITACESATAVRLRCEGNDLIVCDKGFLHRDPCGALYCAIDFQGTTAYCAAGPQYCTSPRCAGDVPVQCVDGRELAEPPCEPGACSVSAEEAVCQG